MVFACEMLSCKSSSNSVFVASRFIWKPESDIIGTSVFGR